MFKNLQYISSLFEKKLYFGYVYISIDFSFIEVCGSFPPMNKNEMSSFKNIEKEMVCSVQKNNLLISCSLMLNQYTEAMELCIKFIPLGFLGGDYFLRNLYSI